MSKTVAARRMAAKGASKAIAHAIRQRKSERAFDAFLQSLLIGRTGIVPTGGWASSDASSI
jgi:hypothetical protein